MRTNSQPRNGAQLARLRIHQSRLRPSRLQLTIQRMPVNLKRATKKDELEGKKSDEYICIHRPPFDFLDEKLGESGEDEDVDEDKLKDEAFDEYKKAAQGPDSMYAKPPAEHPEWKRVIMVDAWKHVCELRIKQTYVDPDNFGMYVYNDFEHYGLNGLVEEMASPDSFSVCIVDANDATRSKISTKSIARRQTVIYPACKLVLPF